MAEDEKQEQAMQDTQEYESEHEERRHEERRHRYESDEQQEGGGSMSVRWSGKAVALVTALASALTFGGTKVLDKTMQDQRQDDRIVFLENEYSDLRQTAKLNSEARIKLTVLVENTGRVLEEVRAAQRELSESLQEHERQTTRRMKHIEDETQKAAAH